MAVLSFNQVKKTSPIIQFLSIGISLFFGYIICKLAGIGPETRAIICFSLLILYAWINPIIGIFRPKWLRYTGLSSLFFILLIGMAVIFSFLFYGEIMIESFINTMLLASSIAFFFVATGLSGLFRYIIYMIGGMEAGN